MELGSTLTVAGHTNLAIVAVVAALPAVIAVRLQVDAAKVGAAIVMSRVAHALSRDALVIADIAALPAAHWIRRKVAAADFRTALGLTLHALTLTRYARTGAAIHVAHSATRRIRRQVATSELIATIDLSGRALACARDARTIAAIDVALAAMLLVLRQIEASCIAFHSSRRAGTALTGNAFLSRFARVGARAAMPRVD